MARFWPENPRHKCRVEISGLDSMHRARCTCGYTSAGYTIPAIASDYAYSHLRNTQTEKDTPVPEWATYKLLPSNDAQLDADLAEARNLAYYLGTGGASAA